LLVQVSTGTKPRRDIAELSAHLQDGGATVKTTIVSDRAAALLGERHFRPMVGDLLGDVALELHPKIADVVADWCAALPAEGRDQEERSVR
jgi:hypothetical protein